MARKGKAMIISWNGQVIAAGQIRLQLNRVIKKVENSILYGIREGAKESTEDGKKIAREILNIHDAMGPRKILFNSIHSDAGSKESFYLIAGHGTGTDEMYPLYIEKGFRPHFVPIAYISDWLEFKASPEVKAYAKARGGLVVGRASKWRTGIKYMEGAYGIMKNNLPTNLRNEILKSLLKKFKR